MNYIAKTKQSFILFPIDKNIKESIRVSIDISLKSIDKHNGNEIASFMGDMFIGKGSSNWQGGQINDTLTDIISSNQYDVPQDLKDILNLWNKHHLNDTYMGTKKQMDYLTSIDFKPINGSNYYEEAKEILIKNGLDNDNGNIFGNKWYFQAIPHEDLMQIYNIIDYKKTLDLIDNYEPYEIGILRDEITKELKTNGFDFHKINKITIIHNNDITNFTEYTMDNNSFKDFFSSRELKIFEELKENGRHIDKYIGTGEIDLTTDFGILLAEIAIQNSPSAMRFLDLKYNEALYTKEEHQHIIDELIEPYLVNNGIDGLIFISYLDDKLLKTSIDNTKVEKLVNVPNYLLDLEKTSLNISTKDFSFDKSNALTYSKEKVFSILSEQIDNTESKNIKKNQFSLEK